MAIYDISSVLLRSQHKKPPYICDGYQDLVFGWVKNPINTCKYKERYRPNRCGSVGHCPAKQKAAGLVPGQSMYKRQLGDVSLPVFLLLFPSL